MYLKEILWLISWPIMLFASYQLSKIALKKMEAKPEVKQKEG
jgi:hypothetical protein